MRFGARGYDAETGRWTAKDPIRFAELRQSLWLCGLAPHEMGDPSGLVVRRCHALAQTRLLRMFGAEHVWIETDEWSAGIQRTIVFYAEVVERSHYNSLCPDVMCDAVGDVDDQCINRVIRCELRCEWMLWVPYASDPVRFPQRSFAFLHRDSNALSELQWGAGGSRHSPLPMCTLTGSLGSANAAQGPLLSDKVRFFANTNDAGSRSEHELPASGTSLASGSLSSTSLSIWPIRRWLQEVFGYAKRPPASRLRFSHVRERGRDSRSRAAGYGAPCSAAFRSAASCSAVLCLAAFCSGVEGLVATPRDVRPRV